MILKDNTYRVGKEHSIPENWIKLWCSCLKTAVTNIILTSCAIIFKIKKKNVTLPRKRGKTHLASKGHLLYDCKSLVWR